MNILSLFGGIECGRVAIDRLGMPVDQYFSSEIDPYAIKITKANYPYPDIIHIGDVKNISYNSSIGVLVQTYFENGIKSGTRIWDASIDLLIGGSPCQDLSIAKKNGKGLDGEKSGLFYEYVRILKEAKPKYFLLENVASMKQSDKEKITAVLREAYPDTAVHMINSSLVSAQNRKRLYWTNILGVTQPEDKGILLRDILDDISMDDKRWKPLDKKYLTDSFFEKIAKGTMSLANIHPSGKGMNGNMHNIDAKSPTLTTNKGEGPKILVSQKSYPVTAIYAGACPRDFLEKHQRELVLGIYQIPRGKNNGGITYGGEKSPTITGSFEDNSKLVCFRKLSRDEYEKSTTPPEGHKRPGNPHDNDGFDNEVEIIYLWRKLTPTECERLQTLPDGYTNHVSDSRRYKAIGNGWTVDVITHILSFIPLS